MSAMKLADKAQGIIGEKIDDIISHSVCQRLI